MIKNIIITEIVKSNGYWIIERITIRKYQKYFLLQDRIKEIFIEFFFKYHIIIGAIIKYYIINNFQKDSVSKINIYMSIHFIKKFYLG